MAKTPLPFIGIQGDLEGTNTALSCRLISLPDVTYLVSVPLQNVIMFNKHYVKYKSMAKTSLPFIGIQGDLEGMNTTLSCRSVFLMKHTCSQFLFIMF